MPGGHAGRIGRRGITSRHPALGQAPADLDRVGAGHETLDTAGLRYETDQSLITEVQRGGHKITLSNVVRIDCDRTGRAVWLERGNPGAGLTHVMHPRRVAEFERHGVPRDEIADLVFRAATSGRPVGVSGMDRTVFEIDFHGNRFRVAVTISDNGFIVGASLIRSSRRLKPLHDRA